MEQPVQWIVIAGFVLVGLLAIVRGAKEILSRMADDGVENALDEWVRHLDKGESVIQAVAGALGVDVKDDDPPEEVAKKVQLAQATGTAKAVRKQQKKREKGA